MNSASWVSWISFLMPLVNLESSLPIFLQILLLFHTPPPLLLGLREQICQSFFFFFHRDSHISYALFFSCHPVFLLAFKLCTFYYSVFQFKDLLVLLCLIFHQIHLLNSLFIMSFNSRIYIWFVFMDWSFYWNSPFYCPFIKHNHHNILQSLSNKFNPESLGVYFFRWCFLWGYIALDGVFFL